MQQLRGYHYKWAAAFCAVFLFVSAAHAQIGVSAGYNLNKLTDVDFGQGLSSFENAVGWHVELWFDLPVGNLALRPGIRYVSAGSIFKFRDVAIPNFDDEFKISMFEVPVDFRFRLDMQVAAVFVTVGPILRFPSGSRSEISGMRSASVAGGVGMGLELNLGLLTLYPELKYSFGLTRFTSRNIEISSVSFSTTDKQLLNGVMLRMGVGL